MLAAYRQHAAERAAQIDARRKSWAGRVSY